MEYDSRRGRADGRDAIGVHVAASVSGHANADWQLLSGAVRRLQDAYGEESLEDEDELRKLVARYHKERLIMPMEVIDGAKMSDLQRLSVLQHQRAATGLLDFTENPLVAIWFACAELPDEDGKVFVLDIGDHQVAQNGRSMDDPFDAAPTVTYYEPDRALGARIIAQQSVFVICNPLIPDRFLKSIVVPAESKGPLQHYLTRLGLSETALFGDVPGLAAANTTRTRLQHTGPISPEQYMNKGNRAYQARRYDDAFAAYESYAAALPDVAQPHCLKGDALAALGRFEEAILAYTKALENIDQPIYIGRQVIVNQELIGNMMSRALYYNRGNVNAAADDHRAALVDFEAALLHGYSPKRNALHNRGNSKFALEMFAEAHQDFEAAWLEREGSDAALAMGNCKVMMGEFAEGLQRYLNGTAAEPENPAAQCRANADQARRLLEALTGHDYRVRREGLSVFVEAACAPGSFLFAGNRGNTGNIPSGMVTAPGGEGYKGANGFTVGIVSPTS